MGIMKEVENPNKNISGEEVVVNDFRRRIPFWSYRPTRYAFDKRFANLREEIDGYLEKLFAGDIDDGNGDTLDNIILDVARQAERSLANQKAEHTDMIKSFDIRAKSDRKAFEAQLSLLREDAERNMEDIVCYEKMRRIGFFKKRGIKE